MHRPDLPRLSTSVSVLHRNTSCACSYTIVSALRWPLWHLPSWAEIQEIQGKEQSFPGMTLKSWALKLKGSGSITYPSPGPCPRSDLCLGGGTQSSRLCTLGRNVARPSSHFCPQMAPVTRP